MYSFSLILSGYFLLYKGSSDEWIRVLFKEVYLTAVCLQFASRNYLVWIIWNSIFILGRGIWKRKLIIHRFPFESTEVLWKSLLQCSTKSCFMNNLIRHILQGCQPQCRNMKISKLWIRGCIHLLSTRKYCDNTR